MKRVLPNCKKAYVPEEKLSNYLLSETHAIGKAKARYFQSIGYTLKNSAKLVDALIMIANSESVSQEITTVFGTKYIIDGKLDTPIGTTVQLRTVWVIDAKDDRPRFITAYPA
ncbi:MAG: DUF6883 domain-containing protein [Pseudomonadota bacterium]